MRVLLVDVDSIMPNLALMKISAYHKAKGDQVGFNVANPDLIYASIVFRRDRHRIDGLRFMYPNAQVKIGGSGYDLRATLPSEIEFVRPDTSIYDGKVCQCCGHLETACSRHIPKLGNIFFSMGFTTRGCIRHCYFCVVPDKEGSLKRWQHPREFAEPSLSTIMLLDNNWFADREWFIETSQWIHDQGLKVWEHGMDIRLLDPEIGSRLAQLKWASPMHFAFDNEKDEQAVYDGIRLLESKNIDVKNKARFYVYLHDTSDKNVESAISRCNLLKQWGATPLIMFNIDKKPTQVVQNLRRWTGRPWIFWTVEFKDYVLGKRKFDQAKGGDRLCQGRSTLVATQTANQISSSVK